MSNVPSDRKYAKSHEWLRLESDGTATVGITDYAQKASATSRLCSCRKWCGVPGRRAVRSGRIRESRNPTFMHRSPERVLAVNAALDGAPEKVNQSPFDDGWMIKLQPANSTGLGALLAADAYSKLIGSWGRSANWRRRGGFGKDCAIFVGHSSLGDNLSGH